MIVNTVAPDATATEDASQVEETAVAGRIGPDAASESNQATDAGPDDEGELRECHSAKVELKLHLENGGSILNLAQVGPGFIILPDNHGHLITAGTQGMLHVIIDGKCDPVLIELTQDIDISTTRCDYRRLDTTAVVESQTQLSKAEQERLFWEEVRLLGELRENESQRSRLDEELATARERHRELQVELNNLSLRIPQIEESVDECCEDTLTLARALWRLKLPASEQSPNQPQAIATTSDSEKPSALPAPQEESNEWRAYPTKDLLAGIKGLGKKKLDAIIAIAPTLGDLEDLREQASKACKQFHEVLPDGCGQGVAQMIEDRQTKYIREHSPNATGGNPLADELLKAFRQKVASESWQATDCVPDSNDTEQTHLGFAAFNEGKPHSALPTQTPELARQWMLGWVCAEVIKHAPPEEQAAAKEEMEIEQAEQAPVAPPDKKPPRKARSTAKKSK